jgi:hypothetical protein
VVGRSELVTLVRRVRRRRRWTAAVASSAWTVGLSAPTVAAALLIAKRLTPMAFTTQQLLGTVAAIAGLGAFCGALRRVPLYWCARAIDRAAESPTNDDRVLAALAFAEPATPAGRFVDALIVDAVARAKTIPPRRAVPAPAARLFLIGAGGIAVVVAAGLISTGSSQAITRDERPTRVRDGRAHIAAVIPLSPLTLNSELEDAQMAIAAARSTADGELARLSVQYEQLITDLAAGRIDAAAAIERLRDTTIAADIAADTAMRARAAVNAARVVLGAIRNPSGTGAALARAIDPSAAAHDANAVASAVDQLAARGQAGRASLQKAAAGAAAALARTAGSDGDTDANAPHRRRLEDPVAGGAENTAANAGADGAHDSEERQLQHLRRDLEQSAAGKTQQTARALSDLSQMARTAEARQRLSISARQLADRMQRDGTPIGDPNSMRRFARAARGGGTTDRPSTQPSSGGDAPARPAATVPATGSAETNSNQPTPRLGDTSGAASAPQDQTGTAAGVGTAGQGAGTGSGSGRPGAQQKNVAGASTGNDARVDLRDSDGAGPSRARVIGAAATQGFASSGYRRVFDDYHAAIEESLDTTAVPPGRRYLVRRYFQLIRPRTPTP